MRSLAFARRFTDGEGEYGDRDQAGNDPEPEDKPKIIMQRRHEGDGEQRSDRRADRIERLAQAVSCAALTRRHHVAHHRIARRAADAFADAIGKARAENEGGCRRDGEQGFGERTEPVAEYGEGLALAEPVGEPAGEELRDRGSGFADSFDQADHLGAGPQHGGQKHRQEAVDHLRGDVHEQTDEAERPHPARHSAQS